MPEGTHRSLTGTHYLLTSKFRKLSANHRQPQRQLIGSDRPGLTTVANDTILPEATGVTQSFWNFHPTKAFIIDLNIYNVPQDSSCIFSAKHDIVYIHIFVLTLLSILCTHKCLMARDT